MTSRSLLPWNWGAKRIPVTQEETFPFLSLRRDINRLFEDFDRGWEVGPWAGFGNGEKTFAPRVDVEEKDKEIVVSAELPGVEEKDVEVSVSPDALTIRGEKKEEKEEKKNYYRKETFQGSFSRQIPLPCDVERDKVEGRGARSGISGVVTRKSRQAVD